MTLQHVDIFMQVIVFLFAISVHESAHAWMAFRLGDNTAYMLGRVTLNPIKHIDPIGTVLLPLLAVVSHFPMIGWAKPTPVNTRNFRHLVRDDIFTSVAGPVSNFMTAIIATVILLLISLSGSGNEMVQGLVQRNEVSNSASPLMPIVLLLYNGMIITNRKSEIGPRARITYHATVMSGVNVGEHGMVGSMGVATKDVPPYHIVAGIPAKLIKVKTIAPESVKASAEKK